MGALGVEGRGGDGFVRLVRVCNFYEYVKLCVCVWGGNLSVCVGLIMSMWM